MSTTAPPVGRITGTAAAGRTPALPPGPRAPGAVQAALWGLRYADFTRAAHARFGSTFTVTLGSLGPVVLTSDRDAIARLLTGDPLRRASANDPLRPMVGDGSLLLLEPAAHLRRRRLLLPPFHGERIAAYRTTVAALAEAEVARWRAGETVRVLPIAQRITLEVILRVVLGIEDAALRAPLRDLIDDMVGYPVTPIRRRARRRPGPGEEDHVDVRVGAGRGARAFLAGLVTPAVLTYFPRMKTRSSLNVITRPWWRMFDRLNVLMDDQIRATRADPRLPERSDVLAMLVRARDEDGAGLGDAELREEIFALIGAGHETTAAAVAWGADLLAHDRDVQARARRAAETDDGAYLAALAKEVLRLRPPLPTTSARRLPEPFAVDGHLVPAQTPITVDALALHHDPQLYPDPQRLRPERFIEASPEPYTWLPFGGGAHRCIGSALAEMEISVVLAAILRRARLAPAEPRPADPVRRAVTLVPSGGAPVRVLTR